MKKLADVKIKAGTQEWISLSKLSDKKVVDLLGSVSKEFGDPMFDVAAVLFEDGTRLYFGAEHDTAWLECSDEVIDDDQLDALYIEENGEDDE